MTSYRIEKRPAMIVMGIACRTSNAPEAGPKDIPKLWDRFKGENIPEKIPNKTSQEIVGLYCDYEGDQYTLVAGCPVQGLETIPEGMTLKAVPAATYAVFHVSGAFPQSLIDTWHTIWQTDLKRTYTGDFEWYPEGFMQSQELEVYIAIFPQ